MQEHDEITPIRSDGESITESEVLSGDHEIAATEQDDTVGQSLTEEQFRELMQGDVDHGFRTAEEVEAIFKDDESSGESASAESPSEYSRRAFSKLAAAVVAFAVGAHIANPNRASAAPGGATPALPDEAAAPGAVSPVSPEEAAIYCYYYNTGGIICNYWTATCWQKQNSNCIGVAPRYVQVRCPYWCLVTGAAG